MIPTTLRELRDTVQRKLSMKDSCHSFVRRAASCLASVGLSVTVVLATGCESMVIPLQVAPYVNQRGEYRIPLRSPRPIRFVMHPGESLPVIWGDLCMLRIRLDRIEPKAYKGFKHRAFHFVIEPDPDTGQVDKRRGLGIDALDYEPVEFTVRERHWRTATVPGVAAKVKMYVDQASTVAGAVSIEHVEIDLDTGLSTQLRKTRSVISRKRSWVIQWDEKEEVASKIELVGRTYQIRAELATESDGVTDRINVSLKSVPRYRSRTEYRVHTYEELWPKRLGSMRHEPRHHKIGPSSKTETGEMRDGDLEVVAHSEISYEIPCLKEEGLSEWKGTLWTDADGVAAFKLSPFARIGLARKNFRVHFAAKTTEGLVEADPVPVSEAIWMGIIDDERNP